MQDKLLTTKQAAPIVGVGEAFLERDRWAGIQIPFIRVGARAVRYRLSDLNDFIASPQRISTVSASFSSTAHGAAPGEERPQRSEAAPQPGAALSR